MNHCRGEAPAAGGIRRRRVRARIGVTVAVVLTAAACSSTKGSGAGGTTNSTTGSTGHVTAPATVNIGFVADMGVPDPDIFYQLEGNVVMTSAYEGLVQYADNSSQIVPDLATSWTVSPDGLTYTFQLRPNVTFHDGSGPMKSKDVEASFMRRAALGPASPPGYMLAFVSGYQTPSPSELVIMLSKPVAPFLDYLAAPYGPKVEDSVGLTAHAGSDMDQTWFKTHDLGTGPYAISQFTPNETYTLSAFAQYWGGAPKVSSIHISILPDISTEQLELKSGQLQMILHGLSKEEEATYEHNPKYQVQRFPANFKLMLAVNEHAGIFTSLPMRQALAKSINRAQIVSDVYGQDGVVSTQIYPTGELAPSLGVDNPTYSANALATVVQQLGLNGKKVNLEYTNDDARNQRVAGIIQAELQAAGLNATDTGIPLSVAYGLSSNAGQRPDLLLTTTNPDASAPDTWVRIYLHSVSATDGALNYLDCSVASADTAMDNGLHETTKAAVDAAYGNAGDLLAADACEDNIADVKDVIVAQAGYSGWFHQPPNLFTVKFGQLSLGGS